MPVTKKTSFLTFSPGRQVSRPRDAESGSNLVRKKQLKWYLSINLLR